MTIAEPTTLITDYLLAALAAIFGVLLMRARTRPGTVLWSIGFLALTGAGLTGGSFHGFRPMMSESSQHVLWNITCLLIGATAGFMLSGTFIGPRSRREANTHWLMAGLALSIAGLVIQQAHISPHPRFNHNDLYHCVQIVGLVCFYRGARMTA